jgi:hypothetical protein
MAGIRAAVAAALIAGAAWVAPAAAPQAGSASPAVPRPLNLQPPAAAEIGQPPNREPWVSADRDQAAGEGCAPAWPCRLRLFGVIQRNGGVGLKADALNW